MTKITKFIIGIIIVVLIGGFLIYLQKRKKIIPETITVKKSDIIELISVTGTVRPSQEIELQFETNGKVKEIFTKVGQKVSAGQLLIKLDDSELQSQFNQQKAALEASQAKLDLLLAGSSDEEIKLAETTVTNAKKSLANSQQNLIDIENKASNDLNNAYTNTLDALDDAYLKSDEVLNKLVKDLFDYYGHLTFLTNNSQVRIEAEANKILADSALDEMKLNLEQTKIIRSNSEIDKSINLYKKDLEIIRNFLDKTNLALNNAIDLSSTTLSTYKTNLSTARTNINTTITNVLSKEQAINNQKITNQINISTAKSSLDTAQANLATSQDQLSLKKAGPRQEDIKYHQSQIAQQKAALNLIAEKISKTKLFAPIDGIITDLTVEKEEVVNSSEKVIKMISSENLEIELAVPESNISKIKNGQTLTIKLDALPEETYSGKILRIDPAETIIQGVVYYKAIANFDRPDEKIKPGMTANSDIEITKQENVLVIPSRMIIRRDNKFTVKVLENNKIVEKEIRVGISDIYGNAEIIEGLKEGEKVTR